MEAIADHIIIVPPPPPKVIKGIHLTEEASKQMKFHYGLVLFVGPKVAEQCAVQPGDIVIFDPANIRVLGLGGDKGQTPTICVYPADVFVRMTVEEAEARDMIIPRTEDASILARLPVAG